MVDKARKSARKGLMGRAHAPQHKEHRSIAKIFVGCDLGCSNCRIASARNEQQGLELNFDEVSPAPEETQRTPDYQ